MAIRKMWILLFLLLLNLASCTKEEIPKTVRIAQTEDLYSLDPDRAGDAQSRAILSNIYEALVEFDGDLKIRGALAVNWNAVDERTWIFDLRKGVKFHDGSALTALDVKASFERVGGPAARDAVIGISGVDVIDDFHVRLRLEQPSPLLLNRLTQVLIVNQKQAAIIIDHPIGTGPYRFVRRTKSILELEAFGQYWKTKPSIQQVSFSPLSATLAPNLFAQKQLDVYRLLPARIQNKSPTDFHIIGRAGLAVMYIWFNCMALFEGEKNPFGDVRVRKAISFAIDRNRIIKRLGGRHERADQLIPNGVFGYVPGDSQQPFDPEEARKLLRSAGYPDGFQTKLTHPPGDSYVELVRMIAEMLAPIGIQVQAVELPFVKFLEARGQQKLPFFVLTWTFDDGDAWTFLMASLHSKESPEDLRSTNPGFSNPVLDELIEQSQQATNVHVIAQSYESIVRMAMSEYPLIPLYRRYDLYGVSNRVRFRPRLDGKLLVKEMVLLDN